MTKPENQDKKLANMSTGGHLGGTKMGQQPDAKTMKKTAVDKGDKARPNDGTR